MNKKILLVDDDIHILTTVAEALEFKGYRITKACPKLSVLGLPISQQKKPNERSWRDQNVSFLFKGS